MRESKDFTNNENNKNTLLIINFQTSYYHIIFLISLMLFIFSNTKHWIAPDNLTSLIALISIEAVQELSGLGFIISFILAIPIVLTGIGVFLILRGKRVKIFLISTGFLMLIYSLILLLVYFLGRFLGKEAEANYSFTVYFYLYILTTFIILVTGIIFPEKRMIENNDYIFINKQVDMKYINQITLIANLVLLVLFSFTPLLKYNPHLLFFMNNSDSISNFLSDKIDLDIFISLVRIIMTVANTVLKVIPIILIIVYLAKNKRPQESLRPNKPVIVYTLIIFSTLWSIVKSISSIVVLSGSMFLALCICICLLLPEVLTANQFKIAFEKTKEVVDVLKQKSGKVIKNFGKSN